MPAAQVFKTLVVRGDKTGVIFACIPGDGELDLKALAKASGNKRARAGAFKRGTAADWLYSRRLFAKWGLKRIIMYIWMPAATAGTK